MPSSFVIERAEPSDAESIGSIRREVWLDTYVGRGKLTKSDTLSEKHDSKEKINLYRNQISEQKDVFLWVARMGGSVVGFCELRRKQGSYYIQAMLILKSARGLGIGAAFLEEVAKLVGLGANLELEVAPFNKPAIEFYKKHGFKLSKLKKGSVASFPSGNKIEWQYMTRVV